MTNRFQPFLLKRLFVLLFYFLFFILIAPLFAENEFNQATIKPGDITGLSKGSNVFFPFDFAIIADPHLNVGRSANNLSLAIDQINGLKPQPKFALILGDLVAEPAEFKNLMSKLAIPYHFILGNNDTNFKEYEKECGPFYYTFEFSSCLFIGLWDTFQCASGQVELRDHEGYIDPVQVKWLEGVLKRTKIKNPPYKHIFIFAHIPLNKDLVAILWNFRDHMRIIPDVAQKLIFLREKYDITACFFGHLHENETFKIGRTDFITTSSITWNFDEVVDPLGYRIVNVGEDLISSEYHPLK